MKSINATYKNKHSVESKNISSGLLRYGRILESILNGFKFKTSFQSMVIYLFEYKSLF